jgi:hypothetical protein
MRVELDGRASEAPPGGDKEAARDVGGAQRKPS